MAEHFKLASLSFFNFYFFLIHGSLLIGTPRVDFKLYFIHNTRYFAFQSFIVYLLYCNEFTFCLFFFGFIDSQGSLTTSFFKDSFFKDINTLSELDESGLHIGTSSGSLSNVFGPSNQSRGTIKSLITKFHLINQTAIDQTAFDRNICCIERISDIKIIIAVWN